DRAGPRSGVAPGPARPRTGSARSGPGAQDDGGGDRLTTRPPTLIHTPAEPTEDLARVLAVWRQRQQAAAPEAELGDAVAVAEYELATREMESIQRAIERRDLAAVEREARARAEALHAHETRGQELRARIRDLETERQSRIQATAAAWEVFAA